MGLHLLGTKRRIPPSPVGITSPDRKKNAYAHFRPGREVDDRLARIPECVREIIEEGHRTYLPVHLFAEEILVLEDKARLAARPGETPVIRSIDILVTEDKMTTDLYCSWSKLHIMALELLDIDEFVIKMFKSHYDIVQTARDFRSAWPTWRLYDIRRRQLVRGSKPQDISRYSHDLFSRITNELSAKALAELEAATRHATATASSRLARSARGTGATLGTAESASSRNAAAPTKTAGGGTAGAGALKNLKFDSCLACASRAHKYDKDAPKQCEPRWLVYDAALGNHKTPTDGAFICWAFNSVGGCKAGSRCRRKTGHVCSLCGDSTHGSQTHPS